MQDLPRNTEAWSESIKHENTAFDQTKPTPREIVAWAVILFPPMGAENRACVSFIEARALFLSYLLVSLLMRAKGL